MTNHCCFRCSISCEDTQDEDYLFFDEHFLKDFNEADDKKINEECNNKKNLPNLVNDKKKFLQYIQNEADTKNRPLKDIYKDIYMNFYLCKKCYGLHNIDIILFYNENSKFHHELMKYVDDIHIIIDEKVKNNVINNMKYIIESYTNNIDIIFFLLYLYVNNILNGTFVFNIQSYNEYYIKIKKFIILHNLIESYQPYLNHRIHKMFSYFLMYVFMFFCYNDIFKTLNLDQDKIKLLIILYENASLVFTNENYKNKKNNNNNNKIYYNQHINDQTLDGINFFSASQRAKDSFVCEHRNGYNKKRKKNNQYQCQCQYQNQCQYQCQCQYQNQCQYQCQCQYQNIYKCDENNIICTHNYDNYHDNHNSCKDEIEGLNQNFKQMDDREQSLINTKTSENPTQGNEQERQVFNECKTYHMYISFHNLCICGYYNKYNKEISQTKWLINNISNSVLSIEECISNIFNNIFSFSTATFIGSGREDKDARMMNIGRPFVYVLKDTKFSFLNFFLFFSNLSNKQNGIKNYNTINVNTIQEYNQFLLQEKKKKKYQHILKNDKQKNIIPSHDNNNCNDHPNDPNKNKNLQYNDIYPLIKEKKENNSLSIFDMKKNIFMKIFLHVQNSKQISYNNNIEDISKGTIHNTYNLNNFFKLPLSYSFNKELEVLFSKVFSFKYCSNYIYSLNITNDSETPMLTDIKKEKEKEKEQEQEQEQINKHKDNNNMYNNSYNIEHFAEIKLNNLSFSTNYPLVKKLMKYGEERKKEYKCIIYHSSKMNKDTIQKINDQISNHEPQTLTYVLKIIQKTPIRVLHRRSLINRERKIFQIKLIYLHKHFSLLYLLAESGLYIKEFVNGDKGRTIPNLKQFFGDDTYVNILNLDVATLIYD
ncbi:hypothetical protein PFAG_05078 [Plasmodium falciparum Santa Lucia]|uniref:tRNA pseudouridine(55) synthase n=2 Tax=Plasmodium falciparum TaxID=5833 RepID=A0A0L7K6H7_PLAFX|nr:hypothetical protein PFAG_05078 [Plasmodium falciparum Santa Lucia]KOB58660.1 hypothetical protein PFHG_00408 [Plasmodium falciparum HB3]